MKIKYFWSLLTVVVIFYGWFISVAATSPYIGIKVTQSPNGTWIVSDFTNARPEPRKNLAVGDIVTKIDNQFPGNYPSVKKWRTIDQAQSITVLHDGKEMKMNIKERKYLSHFDIFSLVGGGISVFFTIWIFTKFRNSFSARLLSYSFLFLSSIFFSFGASDRGDALGKLVINTAVITLPIVFLHFLIVFFKEKGEIKLPYTYIYGLYVIAIAVGLSKIAYFFEDLAYVVYQFRDFITLPVFFLGLILNFMVLNIVFIKYRKLNEYISKITKTIVFSLVISFFPFAFLSFLPLLLFQTPWVEPFYTGCIILFFPISFAYLIISKQVYDIDIVLRRLFFTAAMAILPSIMVVILNAIIFKEYISITQVVISFFSSLILFSLVLYSLEYFTSKFESVVFPRKHLLQSALRKISKNLGSISSFREMKEIILVDIVQTLQVYGGAVVFKYAHHMETISEGDIDIDDVEKLLEMGWFEDHRDYTCFEINHQEEYTSYLVMTRKKTNTMLGLEDRQWLNLIISYLAVSLENVYLIRKLTMRMEELASLVPNEEAGEDFVWFRKLMFELQEKERVRIATDLHDTTMQDLFFLKKRFASIMDNLKLTKEQHTQFQSIVEFVEIINTNLRQSCFDLHPHLLQEIGFIKTVEKLVERESYESSFEIRFGTENAYSIEYKDLDTKRHLFRMVQELITNAKKHSQASKVSIQLVSKGDVFSLLYEDNGVGFDEARMIRKEIGSTGIGMEQIKSRTLHLNGRFDLQTSKRKGVKIQITIPLRGGLPA